MSIIFHLFRGLGLSRTQKPCIRWASGFQREKHTIAALVPLPPPPKKPVNGYILYVQDQLQEMKKSNPGSIHLKNVMTEAASKWKVLSAPEKQTYIDKWKSSSIQYHKIYSSYLASLTDDQKETLHEEKSLKGKKKAKRKKTALLKELDKPKGPPGAYALYFQAQMKKRGSQPVQAFCKSVAEKWRQLPEDEKKVYQNQAEKTKAAYHRELVQWKKQLEQEGKYDLVKKLLTKKSKKKNAQPITKE